jgi:cell division protein FtsB
MDRKDKRKKDIWKRRVFISLTIFLVLVIFAASFFGKRGWLEIRKAQRRKAALQQQIEALVEQKNRLMEEIKVLKEYPEAYEKEAREKLWLMKPGEKVLVEESRLLEEEKKKKEEKKKPPEKNK